MEKRRAGRITDNLNAELTTGGKSYSGIIMNFSGSGLCLVTATAGTVVDITPSTIIQLKCQLPSKKSVPMKCEVKWFHTKNSLHGVSFSIGLEIINPPKEYREFVSSLGQA
ncbi:MAG: PilZ domain-containing protein [Nitrospiraceae bacterium]|nr:MAG: PilZ domain-containing protein [Nitrospiraceae bacterium]